MRRGREELPRDPLGATLHFVLWSLLAAPKLLTAGGGAQTASNADFFPFCFTDFTHFSFGRIFLSQACISLLSKYDYNRRILFELTGAQTMASQAETCEARLSEESLPPAPSSSPIPSSATSASMTTCSIVTTVLGCASTGRDRRSADSLDWSKAQSV